MAATCDDVIQVERVDGVVTVTMNRPAIKNALRPVDFRELGRVLDEIRGRQADRVVVLRGAGGDFCAGTDLSEVGGEAEPYRTLSLMWSLQAVARSLRDVRKPVIAAVDGVAVGAGCSLALGADFIYASTAARFSQIFVRRALGLDLGSSHLLPRRVGLARAKKLAFSGAVVSAGEALNIGLVDRVLVAEELDSVVDETARQMCELPALALAIVKDQLNHGAASTFDEALDYEAVTQTVCAGSVDVEEAVRAFVEKRAPVFSQP